MSDETLGKAAPKGKDEKTQYALLGMGASEGKRVWMTSCIAKYLMRYSEIKATGFYVGTQKQTADDVIKGGHDARLHSAKAEAYLEQNRPANCQPRDQTLLLFPHPIGDRTYCYKVAPLECVDRCHTGWIAQLDGVDPGQTGVVRHYAGLFWKGLECPDNRDAPWEQRSSAAQILKRVGGSSSDQLVPPKGKL